jgi:osmotically-inducible protein OsmY
MIFKERTFRGETPLDETMKTTPSASAELETRAAEFLSSLDALDVTQVSIVALDGGLVLSGYVPSRSEAEGVEASLRQQFPDVQVENRLQVG